jgi:hypothetical protein
MDPFLTPKRKMKRNHVQKLNKADIIAFIQSIHFDYIELPHDITTSADEENTAAFVAAFCDALADILVKHAPAKSSPKKLLQHMTLVIAGTPTKGNIHSASYAKDIDPSIIPFDKSTMQSTTNPTASTSLLPMQPKSESDSEVATEQGSGEITSEGVMDRISKVGTIFPRNEILSMIPSAYHLLINKEPRSAKRPRRHVETPTDQGPIKPVPEHIRQSLLKDRDVLLQAKPPYTLCSLYETEDDKVPFLYIKGVVHPFGTAQGGPPPRYNEERNLNVDAMYDTGNSVTRICGDLVGFKLEPQDVEPCILTLK